MFALLATATALQIEWSGTYNSNPARQYSKSKCPAGQHGNDVPGQAYWLNRLGRNTHGDQSIVINEIFKLLIHAKGQCRVEYNDL